MNSDIPQQHERNSSATSTPPLTQQITTLQFQNQEQEQEQEDHDDEKNSTLKIKLPEFNNGGEGFEEEEYPTTPTNSDQKIPATTTCPPAPRKPKTVPMSGGKRKRRNFQRISVDLSGIMNAMFAPVTIPDFLAGDLAGAGDHSKKVKKANVTTG